MKSDTFAHVVIAMPSLAMLLTGRETGTVTHHRTLCRIKIGQTVSLRERERETETKTETERQTEGDRESYLNLHMSAFVLPNKIPKFPAAPSLVVSVLN